jgi:misacylated tRNA(Ala) deacylase
VTGGAVGDRDGRLDFDIPEAGLDKDEITGKIVK